MDLLNSGELLKGQMLPPEPEIARQLGVSRMTANKAILALVAEGLLTRERGRGTFVPERHENRITRCLVAMHRFAVARVQDDYYYGALYWSIRSFFEDSDVRIDVGHLPSDIDTRLSTLKDTAIIAMNPDPEVAELLARLHRASTRVAILGASWESGYVDSVDSDNLLGSALAVNHLADLGHRRIAFVGGAPEASNTIDRIRGFHVATKARGLSTPESDMIVVPSDEGFDDTVEQYLSKRLTGPNAPTAIFAAGPRLAMQVLSLAQRLSIDVPRELSIIAYDDPSFLSITNPSLTTIKQPLSEMARRACELVTRDSQSLAEGPQRMLLDPEIILRGSTHSPLKLFTEE